MKKTKTYKATIEGLTLHDVIEILALRGEKLSDTILPMLTKWPRN